MQAGSVYAGGQKLNVNKPRLRKDGKEQNLSVYSALGDKERFSQGLLERSLSGISTRNYEETLHHLLGDFGISKSNVSRQLVVATAQELKILQEHDLGPFDPFAVFFDGYHLGGQVYVVALGIDMEGMK